ncbi:hypothetical protein PCE1_002458 [Barthelona sp. PCE]
MPIYRKLQSENDSFFEPNERFDFVEELLEKYGFYREPEDPHEFPDDADTVFTLNNDHSVIFNRTAGYATVMNTTTGEMCELEGYTIMNKIFTGGTCPIIMQSKKDSTIHQYSHQQGLEPIMFVSFPVLVIPCFNTNWVMFTSSDTCIFFDGVDYVHLKEEMYIDSKGIIVLEWSMDSYTVAWLTEHHMVISKDGLRQMYYVDHISTILPFEMVKVGLQSVFSCVDHEFYGFKNTICFLLSFRFIGEMLLYRHQMDNIMVYQNGLLRFKPSHQSDNDAFWSIKHEKIWFFSFYSIGRLSVSNFVILPSGEPVFFLRYYSNVFMWFNNTLTDLNNIWNYLHDENDLLPMFVRNGHQGNWHVYLFGCELLVKNHFLMVDNIFATKCTRNNDEYTIVCFSDNYHFVDIVKVKINEKSENYFQIINKEIFELENNSQFKRSFVAPYYEEEVLFALVDTVSNVFFTKNEQLHRYEMSTTISRLFGTNNAQCSGPHPFIELSHDGSCLSTCIVGVDFEDEETQTVTFDAQSKTLVIKSMDGYNGLNLNEKKLFLPQYIPNMQTFHYHATDISGHLTISRIS